MITQLWRLFYPKTCAACGNSLMENEIVLCLNCITDLPKTNFHLHTEHKIEKLFFGRVYISKVVSLFYFDKGNKIQHLMHEIKYKNNIEAAIFLGKLYGNILFDSGIFRNYDMLIPVPLHPAKKRRRGYNQSEIFGQGLSESLKIKLHNELLIRTEDSESQTRKSRLARWENVKTIFKAVNPIQIEGKKIIIIDDVMTTGATLEACATELLKKGAKEISVITIACATDH